VSLQIVCIIVCRILSVLHLKCQPLVGMAVKAQRAQQMDSSTSTYEEALERTAGESAHAGSSSASMDRASSLGTSFADRLGICLSGLCAIHCLVTPLLILLLPSFHFFQAYSLHEFDEWFHGILLVVLPVVAIIAFVPGYLRHRDWKVFGWSIAGFSAILVAIIAFHENLWLSTPLMIAGSLLLIRAHFLNRHLCACCRVGHGKTHSQSSGRPGRLDSDARFRRVKPSGSRLLSTPRR
jgi:chromate transport protein ChrA